MSKSIKKIVSLVLSICLVVSIVVVAGCTGTNQDPKATAKPGTTAKSYTYKGYATALGTNWNPHSWEADADDAINEYITMPFCTMSIKDSENGIYQWIWEMATGIKDVTKEQKADLTKYGVTLPEGKTADEVEDGYVFEIALNPNAKWENGEKITADDYIYSMEQLLNSKMRNYRSNLYWGGESAVAGGLAYYNSEAPIYGAVVPSYDEGETGDYSFDIDNNDVYISLDSGEMTIAGYSFYDITAYNSKLTGAELDALNETANPYGYIKVTDENKAKILEIMDKYLAPFNLSIYTDAESKEVDKELYMEFLFKYEKLGDKVEYDKVGCYKVDDYTIRYVCQYHIDYNYFLTSCTSTWLVYKDLYESGKDTTGELTTTNYGTSKETTMSYGPYKIDSLQKGKQIIFVQNENWYGWEKQEDGSLVSYTNFEVDGKKLQQYQTTKVVIDVMDDAAAKQAFLKGQLSAWTPSADDLSTYSTSDQLYQVDETYTMSFFFNCALKSLQEMDKSKGNTNSVVLSNINFRKAMSLAINRSEYVTATAGYKPAYATMNNLYFYDVYNDPTSSYRASDEAMQAICNVYDVKYGEGTPYATLKDAYNSINGYNLTLAKELMKTACEELVKEGLYKAGEDIKVRIGWAKGALQSDDNKQVELLNKYINAALEGSGFGKITFEAVGNIDNRYEDTAKGEYAIGYGAWGGAAFYPFRNFQVYMDPDNYTLHEGGCWNPKTVKWTLNVNGEEVEMTCQDWSNCLIGTGKYATSDFATKLSITAQLEEKWLELYYRIPLASTTACFMMSYQMKYYTEDYNIMYDFGGFRLISYNYDDAAWDAYVKSQNNTLNYE